MKRMVVMAMTLIAAKTATFAGETLDFTAEPLTAGRASLVDNGYVVKQTLGEAAFFPELKFPIQLIYQSSSGETGLFGYGWRSPQLESAVVPDANGVVWVTPWGERVRFTAKKEARGGLFSLFASKALPQAQTYIAPYESWTATTPATAAAAAAAASGEWTFTGKGKHAGWKLAYQNFKLASVTAPSGRSLAFAYTPGGLLASVTGEAQTLIELTHDEKRAATLTLNGVAIAFTHADTTVLMPQRNPKAPLLEVPQKSLATIQTGSLNPMAFQYDERGFLTVIGQGDFVETLTLRHEQHEDRQNNPKAEPGKLAADLLGDADYEYKRNAPGTVHLTDKEGRTATFEYNATRGVFKVIDFARRPTTVSYYMRHDVAYLGKVREVRDARNRVTASYRYDKDTGNLIRSRDLAGNEMEYTYTADGDLASVTRRAAGGSRVEPLARVEYDAARNPSAISRLDEKGNPVVTTRVTSNAAGQPETITDGRSTTTLAYTPQGFPATITDAFGQTTKITYDAFNRCVQTLAPNGMATDITFDANGQVSNLTRSFDGQTIASVAVAYDANGRPASYTDHRNRVKRLERDELGRVVREIFPDASEVAYAFSNLGRLSRVVDQNGHALQFEWNNFGLASKETAARQVTRHHHDNFGRLSRVESGFKGEGAADRDIRLAYDNLDRVNSVNYGNNQIQSMTYDTWGRVTKTSNHGVTSALKYDHFGRLIEKREANAIDTYAYNPWGQRTQRLTQVMGGTLRENREYDDFGRLVKITSDEGAVTYAYNDKNQVAAQVINDTRVVYTYTPEGWLESKTLLPLLPNPDNPNPLSTLKYLYASDGQITGRVVDGITQQYQYDAKDQLIAVLDADNTPLEQYTYDPAGNILKKTVAGVTTTYTYDEANQLFASEENGKPRVHYIYDAAGRMVREGGKTYRYGWLDKVMDIAERGEETASFSYHANGQIANAHYADRSESFLWDGLALIRRNETNFLNEPHAGGGAPVLAGGKVMFNDMLGSTLGVKDADDYQSLTRTAYGEVGKDNLDDEFFTGKPNVEGLGYAFLLRNYRQDIGKWKTVDPFGYPDGWNNLAYCNGRVSSSVDWLGAYVSGDHSPHIVEDHLDYAIYTKSDPNFDYDVLFLIGIIYDGRCNGNFDTLDIDLKSLRPKDPFNTNAPYAFTLQNGNTIDLKEGAKVFVEIIARSLEVKDVQITNVGNSYTKTVSYTIDFTYRIAVTGATEDDPIPQTYQILKDIGSLTLSCSATKME